MLTSLGVDIVDLQAIRHSVYDSGRDVGTNLTILCDPRNPKVTG